MSNFFCLHKSYRKVFLPIPAPNFHSVIVASQSLHLYICTHLLASSGAVLHRFRQLRLALFIIVLCLQLPLVNMAQSDSMRTIKAKFEKYNEQALQEKIFVHTDRNFYVAGEIIWFKVYCVNGDNSRFLNLSKVAYIEILNQDRQAVLQAKIALEDGVGSGSLVLPSDFKSGSYIFRSYTSWMKNFDPEFYFHQQLTIVNTVVGDNLSLAKPANNYEVQFFPEGGNMVNDLNSKIAFRVTDNAGKGVDFNGAITNENNDTILHFKPTKFGIGNVSFTPQKGHRYKALITISNGSRITQDLPIAIENGYVMAVGPGGNNESIKVVISTNTTAKGAYLFIHAGKKVTLEKLVSFTNNQATIEIEKSRLEEGISHITVFDQNRQPVAERLYFKRPAKKMIIELQADAIYYSHRKKVTLSVASKDENNTAIAADLSMAVVAIDSLPGSTIDIFRYLWMSSELKGQVESPEYYFNNEDTVANIALDNLMLTHGWRRFKWTDVLNDQKPVLKFPPEFEGHIISGTVVDKTTETPASDISTFLSVPGTRFQLYTSKSSSNGAVNFSTKNLYGTNLLVAMVGLEDKNYRVDLSNPFSESVSFQQFPSFNRDAIKTPDLLKRSVQMQVLNTYTGTHLNHFEQPTVDTSLFYGKTPIQYKLDDYTRFPTMEEVLTEYVPEINIRKRRDRFFLSIVNTNDKAVTSILNPVILLDGLPQFD